MSRSKGELLRATVDAATRFRMDLDNPADRGAGFPTQGQLVACLKRMFEIEADLRSEQLPEKPFRQSGMGRMIVDGRNFDNPLGKKLLEIEHDYLNIG